LCVENQKVLEWEPMPGDWATEKTGKALFLILDAVEVETTKVSRIVAWAAQDVWDFRTSDLIPLFQPRQLIEMLEERGYDWLIESKALMGKDTRYEAVLFGLCTKPDTKIKLRAEGPDPATALLRAWLEVIGKEE